MLHRKNSHNDHKKNVGQCFEIVCKTFCRESGKV